MLTAILLATGLAAIFLLHCAVVGGALLRCLSSPGGGAQAAGAASFVPEGGPSAAGIRAGRDPAWACFFSICLGMLVNMAGLFVLGMLGRLHLAGVAGLALALLGAGGFVLVRRRPGNPPAPALAGSSPLMRTSPPTRTSILPLATLAVTFLLTVAVALHPPGHWDDTMYQLPLARYYADQGAIILNEYLRFPLFPQNFNLLFALGMMLGDAVAPAQAGLWRFGIAEVFAQMFASLPLFVMALGLWAASRRYMGSGIPGLLAGLTLYMIGPVKSTLGFAYIDNGLAMFCLAATLAAARMAEFPALRGGPAPGEAQLPPALPGQANVPCAKASSRRLIAGCVLAGLLAGAACGTKYFGVVFAALLAPVIVALAVLHAIGTSGAMPIAATALRAVLAYAAAVLLAGSGWYVRSFVISGDPAHPAGAAFFGFFLWNEDDLAFQHAEQATHGVVRNPLMFPAALREAGVLLWLPAFAGLFLRRLPPAIRVLQAVFISYMLFWFFVTQVPRYLAPVYGVGGFLAFHALHWAWAWLKRKGAAMAGRGTGSPASTPMMPPTAPAGLMPPGPAGRRERPWACALLLVLAIAYTADRGAKYGREFMAPETVLATNGGYALYQQANLNTAEFGPRLAQVGFEDGIYFFRGRVIGDWFGPGRYRDILECPALPCPLPPPVNLLRTLQKHDARMLLLSRRHVIGLDDAAAQATGWRVLASDANGVLLAAPPG